MTKILIIRLSSIGDILHTFTILPDIRQAIVNVEINWLVDEKFIEIAKLSPLIDNVISIPLRLWKKHKFSWLFKVYKFKKTLIKQKYDYIIDTQGLLKSAILAKYLFKGKVYGLNYKSAREGLASCFYDYSYAIDQKHIAVIRFRALIAKIFNLNIELAQINFQIQQGTYTYHSDYVLLLHGTSKQSKCWPLTSWQQMILWLLNHTDKEIVLTYSNNAELSFANQLKTIVANQRLCIVAQLDFLSLADLIRGASLIIGVDTGFTHMANLLKKKTLAIYRDSDPQYVGMLESNIAHNFGGKGKQVEAIELINYIQEQHLLR